MSPELVKICRPCKAEYIPTVERCPTCGGELVLAAAGEDEDAFVELIEDDGRTARLAEGEPALVAQVSTLDGVSGFAVELAADGIPYRVEPYEPVEETSDGDKVDLSPKPARFQLLIHPRDQDRARAAYQRFQLTENPEMPQGSDEPLTHCPACGTALVPIELGLRCPDCELEFHELAEE